jgi:hypothetical protein
MAVTRLRYRFTNNGTYYIDLWKDLSAFHRKLHRQKQLCTVYGGYMVDSQANRIDLNVAPNNWVTKRAVNRGFAMWRKLAAKTLEAGGMQAPKYSDFKVLLTGQHTTSAAIDAVDAGNNAIVGTTFDWDYSDLTTEDPTGNGQPTVTPDKFNLFITGNAHVAGTGGDDTWSRIGLVKSWLDSRPIPDGNVSAPRYTADNNSDPLVNLFDSSDSLDDHMVTYQSEGDNPPYDRDEVLGALAASSGGNNLQRVSTAVTTAGGTAPVQPIHGFEAVCGLIQVVVTGDTTMELVLDVESKGVGF